MAATRERVEDLEAFSASLSDPGFFIEILDSLSEPVYIVDRFRTIRFWSQACEQITGYPAAEVVGRHCYEDILRHVDENGQRLCVGLCPLAHTIRDGRARHTRVWLHHKRGHRVAVEVGVRPIHDRDGRIIGAIETFTDGSVLAAAQERVAELEKLAMVDALTGVPNRRFLELTITSRLAELRRHGAPFALVFGDLDHFKQVNDQYGHAVGDKVLQMTAATLAGNLRVSDIVARFGGEEFVLILGHTCAEATLPVCERLRTLVAASSLDMADGSLSVTISLGVTAARTQDSPDTLLQRADSLLYLSKQEGRDRTTTDIG